MQFLILIIFLISHRMEISQGSSLTNLILFMYLILHVSTKLITSEFILIYLKSNLKIYTNCKICCQCHYLFLNIYKASLINKSWQPHLIQGVPFLLFMPMLYPWKWFRQLVITKSLLHWQANFISTNKYYFRRLSFLNLRVLHT